MQRLLPLAAAFAAGIGAAVFVPKPHTVHSPAAHHAPSAHTSHAPDPAHPFIVEMDRDMATMMADMHAPGYTGRWDVDFLAMMIPHHQGAIDMARAVLVHGKDPATRALAEDIIASQRVEIDAMQARLKALRAEAADDYPALSGTRGEAP